MAIDHVLLTDTFGHWVDTTNEIIDLVNAQLDSAVLANLLTSDKSSLVGAINELYNTKYNKTGGLISGSAQISGDLQVDGKITIGVDGAGNSCLEFYDDTNNVVRALCYDASAEEFTIEDGNGDVQKLLYTGKDIDLGTFSSLPTDTQLQFKSGTEAENDAYTGAVNEITVDAENGALRLHDGVTPGGTVISGGGAGEIKIETFRDGIEYTAGVDTVLSLADDPGAEQNVFVFFSGVYQEKNAYVLSGQNLIFTDPIPSDSVEVAYGLAIEVGVPSAGTVGLTELQGGTPDTIVGFDGAGNPVHITAGNGIAITGGQIETNITEYDSGELSFVNGDVVTLAHGLGGIPKEVDVLLINQTTEQGWGPGDAVFVSGGSLIIDDTDAPDTQKGVGVGSDGTNLTVSIGADGITVPNKTTGSVSGITAANWKIRVFARNPI